MTKKCFVLIFSATTPSSYFGGGFVPKSKIIDTIRSTIGYDADNAYGRHLQDAWPNDNPFTTTSTVAPPYTKPTEKATSTAMLEVFQWLYSSTVRPIADTISTWAPTSTPVTFATAKDEWGNSIETYRVDEPPHWPGLSLECRYGPLGFARSPLFVAALLSVCFGHRV